MLKLIQRWTIHLTEIGFLFPPDPDPDADPQKTQTLDIEPLEKQYPSVKRRWGWKISWKFPVGRYFTRKLKYFVDDCL